MRDFDLRELQLREFGILEELDRLCKKHNIEYFLSYGTALGAVRHKGFIPWDDDIDVSMKLDDYRVFKEVCKKELDPKFFFQDLDSDPYVHITWGKLRENNTTSLIREMADYPVHWGICIDVFPMVPLTNNRLSKMDSSALKMMYLCANKKLNAHGYGSYGVLSNKTKLIPNFLCKPLYHLSERYFLRKRKEINYYFDYCLGEIDINIYDKNMWEESIKVPFESGEYPIMKEYDRYLTQAYGSDYMQIPKVENQVDHGDIIVDLDRSYKEYIK